MAEYKNISRMEKAKRGRPKKENNCNDMCTIFQVNLKPTYGNYATNLREFVQNPSTIAELYRICLQSDKLLRQITGREIPGLDFDNVVVHNAG